MPFLDLLREVTKLHSTIALADIPLRAYLAFERLKDLDTMKVRRQDLPGTRPRPSELKEAHRSAQPTQVYSFSIYAQISPRKSLVSFGNKIDLATSRAIRLKIAAFALLFTYLWPRYPFACKNW